MRLNGNGFNSYNSSSNGISVASKDVHSESLAKIVASDSEKVFPLVRQYYAKPCMRSVSTGSISFCALSCSNLKPASGIGRFNTYRVEYPTLAGRALEALCDDYNREFRNIIEQSREFPTDYGYVLDDSQFLSLGLQVDMASVPQPILERCAQPDCSLEEAKALIRPSIFEFENSLAGYNLLATSLANREIDQGTSSKQTTFSTEFRNALDAMRSRTGKKIALVTLTETKHAAVLGMEFGRSPSDEISDDYVFETSGFDKYMSPTDFVKYGEKTHFDHSDYMFFFRPSADQKNRLKSNTPDILHDSQLRQFAKKYALTPIDGPFETAFTSAVDTKKYIAPMGLGYEVSRLSDLVTHEFACYVDHQKSLSEQKIDLSEKQAVLNREAEQWRRQQITPREEYCLKTISDLSARTKKDSNGFHLSADEKHELIKEKKTLISELTALKSELADLKKARRVAEEDKYGEQKSIIKQALQHVQKELKIKFSGDKYNPEFLEFLRDKGIDINELNSGSIKLRAKPRDGAFGCYGHETLDLSKTNGLSQLKNKITQEPYVVQPEIPMALIESKDTGRSFGVIHRNFVFAGTDSKMHFNTGFVSAMPVESHEFKMNRSHGNVHTVWGEVSVNHAGS